MPLRTALVFYAQDIQARDKYMRLSLHSTRHRDGPLNPTDRVLLAELTRHLTQELVTALTAGWLVAKGFPPGSLDMRDIPPAWWRGVKFDFPSDAAEAGGLRLHGIMVQKSPHATAHWPFVGNESGAEETKSPGPSLMGTGAPGRPATSVQFCLQQMQARAAGGELAGTLQAEAAYLAQWVKNAYNDIQAPTAKTVENKLRDDYKRLKAEPPKR